MIFLNHGSYGATPRVVLEAQAEWRLRLERQPVRFMRRELLPALRAAATELAAFMGARGEDLVFVDNATTSINAVLRSLELDPGDEIVATDHTYGAVRQALTFVCGRAGAQLVEAVLPFPGTDEAGIIDAVARTLGPKTRLVVLDHVTSPSALVVPVERLVQLCRERGVPVLVDGAHALGMLPLALERIGADWYVGNCHKWLCAAKGCGFLWTSPRVQSSTHPTVISHGLGEGYLSEFDWTGTRDFSTWLSVTAALAFHQSLGPETVRAHNHELVVWARDLLAQSWGTELCAPAHLLGSMAVICTDRPAQETETLHDYLWDRHRIEVPVIPLVGAAWIRISAQVYNEPEEYRQLAAAVHEYCLSECRE